MDNMDVTVSCKTTIWKFVCRGAEIGLWLATAIEKMEAEHGFGASVAIYVRATDADITIQ